jgi:hypothetical protein
LAAVKRQRDTPAELLPRAERGTVVVARTSHEPRVDGRHGGWLGCCGREQRPNPVWPSGPPRHISGSAACHSPRCAPRFGAAAATCCDGSACVCCAICSLLRFGVSCGGSACVCLPKCNRNKSQQLKGEETGRHNNPYPPDKATRKLARVCSTMSKLFFAALLGSAGAFTCNKGFTNLDGQCVLLAGNESSLISLPFPP